MDRGIALGGFMGVGKSTVGPLLADRLRLGFVDLDDVVAQAAGQSVAEIFVAEGEEGFRVHESAAIDAVIAGPPCVLALGGGSLHHGDNLARLRMSFDIVVLDAPWPVLAERIRGSVGPRPLAAGAGRLYASRREGYLSAGRVVAVDGLSPGAVVDHILEGG
jgi:shikimate kinase